jgi:hypothetical protein
VYAALSQQREDATKFAVSHKRLTTDNRDVQRAMAIDERHEARDQFVPFVVGEAAKRDVAAKMIVAVRVAAGAPKGTFACDFN